MISVIIPTRDSQSTLAATLESLIPAAVDGLVREVIVTDGGSKDATLTIADSFGATVVSSDAARASRLNAGAQLAKSEWLLFLDPDCLLQFGWEREVERFVAKIDVGVGAPTAAAFRFTLQDRTWSARAAELAAYLSSAGMGIVHCEQGLLIPRSLYVEVGGFANHDDLEFADLSQRLGRKRIARLRAISLGQSKEPQTEYGKTLLKHYANLALFTLINPTRRSSTQPTQLVSPTPPTTI